MMGTGIRLNTLPYPKNLKDSSKTPFAIVLSGRYIPLPIERHADGIS